MEYEVKAWPAVSAEPVRGGSAGWVVDADSPADALRKALWAAQMDSVVMGRLAPLPQLTHPELDLLYGVLDREVKRISSLCSQANIAEQGGQRTSLADLREALLVTNSLRTAVGEARSAVMPRDRATNH